MFHFDNRATISVKSFSGLRLSLHTQIIFRWYLSTGDRTLSCAHIEEFGRNSELPSEQVFVLHINDVFSGIGKQFEIFWIHLLITKPYRRPAL